jgi:hypothetical protein
MAQVGLLANRKKDRFELAAVRVIKLHGQVKVQLHSFFDVQLDGLNIQLSAVSALTLGYH